MFRGSGGWYRPASRLYLSDQQGMAGIHQRQRLWGIRRAEPTRWLERVADVRHFTGGTWGSTSFGQTNDHEVANLCVDWRYPGQKQAFAAHKRVSDLPPIATSMAFFGISALDQKRTSLESKPRHCEINACEHRHWGNGPYTPCPDPAQALGQERSNYADYESADRRRRSPSVPVHFWRKEIQSRIGKFPGTVRAQKNDALRRIYGK